MSEIGPDGTAFMFGSIFLIVAWLCRGKPNDLTEGLQLGFLVCGWSALIWGALVWAVAHISIQ